MLKDLRRNLKSNKYLFISFLLHIILFIGLINFKSKLDMPPKLIEVEYQSNHKKTESKLARLQHNLKSKSAVKSKKSKPAQFTFGSHNIKLFNNYSSAESIQKMVEQSRNANNNAWSEGGYTLTDDPHKIWGVGAGTFERVQDYNLMEFIFAQTESYLFYPSILAAHRIEGTVNTRLVLNKEGDCEWRQTQINAANRYLRVYVLHLLKKVCNQNFSRYLNNRILTNVDMSFQFALTEKQNTDENTKSNQHIVGNVLMFYRNAQTSITEWHLGPFTGVFPIPWVNLDFNWIQENFEKYVNNHDPISEFREN